MAYFSPVFANGELAGRLVGVAYVVAYVLFGAAACTRRCASCLVRGSSTEGAAPAGCSCSCCRTAFGAAAIAFSRAVGDKQSSEQLTIIGAP